MRKISFLIAHSIVSLSVIMAFVNNSSAQINILSTNSSAEEVMLGNYDRATYTPTVVVNHPDSIIKRIMANINADSLLNDLVKLASFQNRNSGSDTVSSIKGIGAARRWVYSKFQQISSANNNRLIPSY